MSFLTEHFITNAKDILFAGSTPLDYKFLQSEFLFDHRLKSRQFLCDLLPKGGVGAELGVFTGLFSTILLDRARPKSAYFVDPWWLIFGNRYPDWGIYTANGRLSTRRAHDVASRRIKKNAHGASVSVHVAYSVPFLEQLPDDHLDWVYLDSSHSYAGTAEELKVLRRKVKPGGIVAGDDWHDTLGHTHSGVAVAIREAVEVGAFQMIGSYPALQWAIRRP
ncbi:MULTISPECIES: class I SAM-dependent methyltransferase [unclassified Rhizobium]|uniref:class I SAM-dependent methyltransferase n=1 Tax=unclassified Rhizobium TaxID=2613769 RepID=UPI002180D1D7|nr:MULTISPECIES: class I SAM-dependent methyltransferase [unclassified Rhizobium]